MSVDPVTVTVTIPADKFGSDLDAPARAMAAIELGLEESQIFLLQRGAATHTPEVHYGDSPEERAEAAAAGTAIKVQASMTIESTWAPIPIMIERRPHIAWPEIELGRGSRWNGVIPSPEDPTVPIEVTLISDGKKLVRFDSPEGQAVLQDLHGDGAIEA